MAAEELKRVLPVIEPLASSGAIVSIDTYKAVVAREAIARGASIVNDISGFLSTLIFQRWWRRPAPRWS